MQALNWYDSDIVELDKNFKIVAEIDQKNT